MVLRCCVPRCQNTGRFGFHKFPRDEEHCFKWQFSSRKRNISTKYLPFSSYRVCEKHFKDEDYDYRFGKKRLNKTAVPSVCVPGVESVYEEHNYVEMVNGEELISEHISMNGQIDESKKTPVDVSKKETKSDPKPQMENVHPKVAYNLQSKVATEASVQSGCGIDHAKDNIKNDRIPQHIHRQLKYKDNRIKTLQKKLKESNNLGQEKVIVYLSKHFNKDQMTFFTMQLRNTGKKNHGQRYTKEEKVMMLAIYKRGPRAYRYLSLLFGLPSRRTLCRQSAQLKFETGINTKLFDLLKSRVSEMSELNRYCTIGWDEVALTHHLTYCDVADCIDGFVDLGNVRIPDFATHSLTFMIRGINHAYKQPVAYFFTQSMIARDISDLIILVIRAVHETGLRIVGSVCDQTGTMAAAVNRLINPLVDSIKQTGQLMSYEIDGMKIIHCFDPPHILKTIRNNLLNKNLKHFVDGLYDPDRESSENKGSEAAVASWKDIQTFYDFDIENSCRLVEKITKKHINPESEKMKVLNAAQVFSRSLGSMLLFCSKKKLLPNEIDCSGTAYILLFINDLFDSLNGGGQPVPNTFRGSITENNKGKYFDFWKYAIKMLEKMSYVDIDTGCTNNRSSVIQKTISTVKGYMELTKLCLSLGIKSIALRRMNQDGLEIFFGSIRSVCHNPNAVLPPQFRSGYTTLILNNLSAKHSAAGNCEEDDDTSLLKNVYELYDIDDVPKTDESQKMNSVKPTKSIDDDTIQLEVAIEQLSELKLIESTALTLELSNACKWISTSTKCELCKCTLEAYCPLDAHDVILSTDSDVPVRTYPTLLFMNRFKQIYRTVETLLPFISHERSLLLKITTSLDNVDCDGLGCKDHKSEIACEIKKVTARLCLMTYIRQINCILSKRSVDRASNQSDIHDKAFDIVTKKKGIGKFGQTVM